MTRPKKKAKLDPPKLKSKRKLSNWLESYMLFTDNTESAACYRRWSALSAISACLRRDCYFRGNHGEHLFPNMYVVLVGPSGFSRKNTAIIPAKKMLIALDIEITAGATTREALIRDLIKASKVPTVNGAQMSASLTVFVTELVNFINTEHKQLLGNLTEWYDCEDPWINATIKRDRDVIDRVCLNILGGTTPKLIRSCLPVENIGGGFSSRVIYVYAPDREKIIADDDIKPWEEALEKELIYDLRQIRNMVGQFKPTKEAVEYYGDWYNAFGENPPPLAYTETFGPYCSRKQTHVRKVAMILSAARSNNMIMERKDYEQAIRYLTELEPDLPKVFEGAGMTETGWINRRVGSYIQKRGQVIYSEIFNHFGEELTRHEIIEAVNLQIDQKNVRNDKIKDDRLLTWIGIGFDKYMANMRAEGKVS